MSPIVSYNVPTPVPGAANGYMPASDLVWVDQDCLAYRSAGPSLGLLLATARDEGVAIGTEECYRPIEDQVSVKQSWTAAGNSACAAPVVTAPTGKPKGTSMHGWGEAADFSDAGESVSVGSAVYRFLEADAGRFGWNHPGWARPGGSACPEAWHWEWVGNGGILHDSSIRADVVGLLTGPSRTGYATVSGLGAVVGRGSLNGLTRAALDPLAALIVAVAPTPDGRGYWMVGADGGVFAFGDARFAGSFAHAVRTPTKVFAGIAPTPDGAGYWLLAVDGAVYPFGDARSYGEPSHLARAAVAIVSTPSGRGYWVASADGHVHAYGDARSFGDDAARLLAAPVVAMARTNDGGGYWLAGADGAVSAFGDARSYGSAAGAPLREPVVAMAPTADGGGYSLVAADGGVFTFGDAVYLGTG